MGDVAELIVHHYLAALELHEATGVDDVEQHLAEGFADEFHKSPEFYRVRSVDGVMPHRTS